MAFTWELVTAEDGEVRVKLEFENPEIVSSHINNDQIKITIKDPAKVKKDTVIVQDIVRQVDGEKSVIKKLDEVTTWFTWIWVCVGVMSFVYFLILTGGKEDPFLWCFLETMQLLTHI